MYKNTEYLAYIRRPMTVLARRVTSPETVKCYNGNRVAKAGEYVVVASGKIMIMTETKFHARYRLMKDGEEWHEQRLH